MKLIDADLLDIKTIVVREHDCEKLLDVVLEEDIDDAEAVKAIPLDKMEKKFEQIISEIQSLRGCSCDNSDGIIDDVEDIINKYRQEKI